MLLRVPIGDGEGFVEVEVDPRDLVGELEMAAGRSQDVTTAPFSLAESMDRVLPALNVMLKKLRTVAHAPDEIGMELGLKVGGETGLVFAKASGEATFTITMTWRKPATDHAT
jgi:hypothetical protein